MWINSIASYFLGKYGCIFLLAMFAIHPTFIGYFDISSALAQLPSYMLTVGFVGIVLSAFSRLPENQPEKMKKFWENIVQMISTITIPIYFFIFVFTEPIIRAIYSESYIEGAILVQILVLSKVIARIFGGGENFDALLTLRAEKPTVGIGIMGGIIQILLLITLIPLLGVEGGAIASGFSTIIVDTSTFLLLKKHLKVKLQLKPWIQIVAISVIPIITVRLIWEIHNLIQLLIGFFLCTLVWGIWILYVRKRWQFDF